MRGSVIAAAWLATAALGVSPAGADLNRYRDLMKERHALMREKALLEIEARTAATGEPYVLLDLEAPALQFRIRGKTLKTYRIAKIAADARGRDPVPIEAVWGRFPGPLEVLEVQGGQPELVPPDPNTGRETGLLYTDPNQIRSQTGAVEVDTDAGILGIEAPTDYWIRLDEPIVLHIRTEKNESISDQAFARLAAMASDLRKAASRLWGTDGGQADAPVHLWITMDPDTARHLHHSLLPGERVFLVPPSAPPLSPGDDEARRPPARERLSAARP